MRKKKCMDIHKMRGLGMLILGLLILANVRLNFLTWYAFWGFILVLVGVLKLAVPHKEHK